MKSIISALFQKLVLEPWQRYVDRCEKEYQKSLLESTDDLTVSLYNEDFVFLGKVSNSMYLNAKFKAQTNPRVFVSQGINYLYTAVLPFVHALYFYPAMILLAAMCFGKELGIPEDLTLGQALNSEWLVTLYGYVVIFSACASMATAMMSGSIPGYRNRFTVELRRELATILPNVANARSISAKRNDHTLTVGKSVDSKTAT